MTRLAYKETDGKSIELLQHGSRFGLVVSISPSMGFNIDLGKIDQEQALVEFSGHAKMFRI